VSTPQLSIDFTKAPHDPIERLVWLSAAQEVFNEALDEEWRKAYFGARLSGRIRAALDLKLHSRKRVLAFTRAENELRGRALHWGDGFSV
jgi:hypothetical protein